MKLYGIAIAAVRSKSSQSVMDVTCTPISVTDKKRREFQIEDGAFKCTVDFRKMQEAVDCYIRTVELIDSVVGKQKQSLAERGIPYRPVVLEVGQDSRRPIYTDFITIPLFNESFYKAALPVLPKRIWSYYKRKVARDLAALDERYAIEDQQVLDESDISDFATDIHRANDRVWAHVNVFAYSLKEHFLLAAYEVRTGLIRRARTSFIIQDIERFLRFQQASRKLSGLLIEGCTLTWGSFAFCPKSKKGEEHHRQLEEKLFELRDRFFQGDPAARAALADIARAEGAYWGRYVTKNPHTFAMCILPRNYHDDPLMQYENPGWNFYDWDPSFRKAFYAGYREKAKTKYYKHLKLPTDPLNPFFTDPYADKICDQFEIIERKRSTKRVDDTLGWRVTLAVAAQNARVVEPAAPSL